MIAEVGWVDDRRELERDAAGQICRLTHPSGSVVEYEWTRVGKLARVNYGDGSFERFVYQPDGLVSAAQNETCTIEFERDPLGRVTREWQGEHWIESEYGPGGERRCLRSSFGIELDVERDAMGRWSRLELREDGRSRWSAETTRDAAGDEIARQLPGGALDRWARDALGRPTQHQVWDGRAVARDVRYAWDVDDRLRAVINVVTGQRSEHQHDALGRLTSTRRDDAAELRIPDALGNIYRSADRVDRFYGADGRLLRAEDPDGPVQYEYDLDGRRVMRIGPDGVWSYRWNAAGRLIAVERPDCEIIEFGYDALGRRVWKRFRGQTTRWIWDGDVILHEWMEDNAPVEVGAGMPGSGAELGAGRSGDPKSARGPPDDDDEEDRTSIVLPVFAEQPARYGFADDDDVTGFVAPVFDSPAPVGPRVSAAPAGLITWVSDPQTLAPAAKLVDGRAYSVVCDHLGTPALMLDERGQRVWAAEISTWGQVRVLLGDATDCPHRFAGQYEDAETGLVYNRYRYFDPEAGQYLCVDPIRLAGGLNSFAYVGDPLTELDPLGLAKVGGPGDCGGSRARGKRTPEEAGISPNDALRIQNAANRTEQTITVVGSRARGTATSKSDWDYVMSGKRSRRHSAKSSVPRGIAGGENNRGIDVWQSRNPDGKDYWPVEPDAPHVTFEPESE